MQNNRISQHWGWVALLVWLPMAGCAARAPLYPQLDTTAAASVLVIDNQSDTNPLTALAVDIRVDGFAIGKPSMLFAVGGVQAMPVGVTELRIPAGSHELVTHGLMGNSPYYYNPVRVHLDTQAGQTYTVRLRKGAGRFWQPGYFIEYEGWADDVRAQWPSESLIANPLF